MDSLRVHTCIASASSFVIPVGITKGGVVLAHTVGCIYASYPQYKSNILQVAFIVSSSPSPKHKTQHNYFFSEFYCIFTDTSLSVISFLHYSAIQRFAYLLLARDLPPSRGAPTGLLAPPDRLADR